MLGAGVHPKIAQERLGHSSVSVTIDLYSHVLPGMQAEAVSRVDAAMEDGMRAHGFKVPKPTEADGAPTEKSERKARKAAKAAA